MFSHSRLFSRTALQVKCLFGYRPFRIIVHFISVGRWSDSANISGFPWWIFFGFFANERQHFETNKNEKIKKMKRKIKKNEKEKQELPEFRI